MGGGEAFDRLKDINPDVKVILSSGCSLNGEASGIMARGCQFYSKAGQSCRTVAENQGGPRVKVKDPKE